MATQKTLVKRAKSVPVSVRLTGSDFDFLSLKDMQTDGRAKPEPSQPIKQSPSLLDRIPSEYRADLEALETLSDDELWQVAESTMPIGKHRRMSNLLWKNQEGILTEKERQALDALCAEAGRLMLQKSYAYLLLKPRC